MLRLLVMQVLIILWTSYWSARVLIWLFTCRPGRRRWRTAHANVCSLSTSVSSLSWKLLNESIVHFYQFTAPAHLIHTPTPHIPFLPTSSFASCDTVLPSVVILYFLALCICFVMLSLLPSFLILYFPALWICFVILYFPSLWICSSQLCESALWRSTSLCDALLPALYPVSVCYFTSNYSTKTHS